MVGGLEDMQNAEAEAEHAETVAAIRARVIDQMSPSQRVVEKLTAYVGRPTTIVVLVALIGAWIAWNSSVHLAQGGPVDPPPFFWLQGAVALYAALVTTFILTTQNREKRHAEQRSFLELQVNLLAEQKTAKIIELIEELRRDMPTVRNRVDKEADALQSPVDPHAVMNRLEATMDSRPPDEAEKIGEDD